LAIQADAVRAGERVVTIDDVVASGETALAGISLIERAGGHCLAGFPDRGMPRIIDRSGAFEILATDLP